MLNQYLLLFSLAILPVIILLAYIYGKDRFHKEPGGLLALAFGAGVLVIFPVVIIEVALEDFCVGIEGPIWQSVASGFLGAAVPEEVAKFLIFMLVIWNHREFDERIDGIVYIVFISLGFACFENLLYVFSHANSFGLLAGIKVSGARALFSVPCHFLSAVLIGYYVSLAKFRDNFKVFYIFWGLFLAILFHGLFDTILFTAIELDLEKSDFQTVYSYFGGFLLLNLIVWYFATQKIEHLACQTAEKTLQ